MKVYVDFNLGDLEFYILNLCKQSGNVTCSTTIVILYFGIGCVAFYSSSFAIVSQRQQYCFMTVPNCYHLVRS